MASLKRLINRLRNANKTYPRIKMRTTSAQMPSTQKYVRIVIKVPILGLPIRRYLFRMH